MNACMPLLLADFSAADEFLNDPETRKMLGVGDRLWVSCAMDVYEDMSIMGRERLAAQFLCHRFV
eukprot:1159417-Pelagomonas_calceolata.AAC.8